MLASVFGIAVGIVVGIVVDVIIEQIFQLKFEGEGRETREVSWQHHGHV